jgi:hypothetical protein
MKLGYKVTVQKLPPPLPLAWAFWPARAGDAVTRLHKTHYRSVWRSRTLPGALAMIALLPLWPFLQAPRVWRATRRNGARIRQLTGKSLFRQMCEQFCLTARSGFSPSAYYAMEWFIPAHAEAVAGYVQRAATKDSIYRMLAPATGGTLTDKVGFASYCQQQGLPAASIILSLNKGRVMTEGFSGLPPKDLFVKRTRGRGGSGAEIWLHDNGSFRRIGGKAKQQEVLEGDALVARLCRLAEDEPYLVQERMVNHADLHDLCQGALATVRLVTILDEQGNPEPVRAVLRMPATATSVVDNFHAGGIATAIDLKSGLMGPATDRGLTPSLGWVERHPISGAQITGRVLPRWPEILALALRAHRAYPTRICIGWDIADTDAGPMIVEGNAATDTDIIQRVHRSPLSETRYAELMNWHIAQRYPQP